MKDAFGNKLVVGSKVIFSTSGGGGTEYTIGKVVKLYPYNPKSKAFYVPPDKVAVKPLKLSNGNNNIYAKNPILYAANVVELPIFAW